jgi:hypothetical protein
VYHSQSLLNNARRLENLSPQPHNGTRRVTAEELEWPRKEQGGRGGGGCSWCCTVNKGLVTETGEHEKETKASQDLEEA